MALDGVSGTDLSLDQALALYGNDVVFVRYRGTRIAYCKTIQLGEGSFGEVYKGWRDEGRHHVAVKITGQFLFDQQWNDWSNLEREIMIMQLMRGCDNVVRIYEAMKLSEGEGVMITMEMCDGNLQKLLNVKNAFKENEVMDFLHQLGEGMKELQKRNIIHLHIKPENILIKYRQQTIVYKLSDFYARHFEKIGMLKSVAGTPIYMAPEVVKGLYQQEVTYDDKADIWSIGAVLYKVLVGDHAFPPHSHIYHFLERKKDSIAYELKTKRGNPTYIDELPVEVQKRFSRTFCADITELLVGMLKFDKEERTSFPIFFQKIEDLIESTGHPVIISGEDKYLEAYQYFVNNKESLPLLFLKFLVFGPPRLGKSTTLRRLMGEIVDLKSSGEVGEEHPSTGAVESGAVLVRNVSNTTAVVTQSEWLKVECFEDEAGLLHNLIDTFSKPKKVADTSPQAPSERENISSQPTSQSVVETEQIAQEVTPAQPIPQSSPQSKVSTRLEDNLKVKAVLSEAMKSKHWKKVKHMFKAYLRVEDTGGQPELMDMLPALTIGPGLYLLFMNLQNDLNQHCKLAYCNKSGISTPSGESIYTIKEMLLSAMASIYCSSAFSPKSELPQKEDIIPGVHDILKKSKSKAYIVGTFKDKVTDSHIKELNQELQKIIESTKFGDIVEFFSDKELIVAIDNMAGGAEEVKKIQVLLDKCMSRCFSKLTIPVVWLLLSLVLRSDEKRTISLEECQCLSKALNMNSYETNVALWFLHHHAGVLMYFPEIAELKDLVIVDIQIVYDSVTILILRAMNWEEVGVSTAKKFKKTGKFTIEQISTITSEVSDDVIPIHKLVVLLEYLHIIARISSHHKICSVDEEVTYIMPCVLNNATKEELDSISKELHVGCPIMIHFKCGFVPIGIFPAMTACLINNDSFSVIDDGIRKNVIQFRYGIHRTLVTFMCRSMYYEFIVTEITSGSKLHEEFSNLRKMIEATFEDICSHVNCFLMDYQFAFECPIHAEQGRDHLCVVNNKESSPVMMDCLQNTGNPKPVPLSAQHKLWFGQELSQIQTSAHPLQMDNEKGATESCEELASQKLNESSSQEDSKYQKYVEKIVKHRQNMLTCEVKSDKHIRELAETMTGWEDKFDLFGLNRHDVHDIKHGVNKDKPKQQRIDVILEWRQKSAPDDTYGNLLQLFVKGHFNDCATKMVAILNGNSQQNL